MNKWIFSFCLLLLGPLRAEEKPHDPPLFPIEKNGGDGVSPAKGKIFSDRLRELHEASLMPLADDENAEVYRLILVNYWDTHATVIKLTKKDDGYEVMLACPEVGKPGEATRKLERRVGKLDAGTVEGFQNRLKAASFFTMPTVGKNAGDDGEDWVLEAVRDGKYHVVVRWSPSEDDPSVVPFLATCRWLKEHA
ncbi:MAG: hypothetical protein JWO82_1512, partial [Akkermansiaceae bacterium]|nr:hypothetical protein [Akkermansiaceae bacterium]